MAVAASWLIVAFLLLGIHSTEAQIGVCYGRLGDNLPCAEEVVNLYEYYNIGAMRLYEPDLPTLEALQGTNIQLMLGVRNQDISCIGSDQSNADDWVETNVLPYATTIKYIAVGNEIKPNSTEAPWVEPAMQNILRTLNANGLGTEIKVSTAIDTGLIKNSYPPSNAEFSNLTYITPIINFLRVNDFPLLVNIQPYIAYMNAPKGSIPLDYLLFRETHCVLNDTYNGVNLCYKNLFDAMYDAMYIATQKVCECHNNSNKTLCQDKKSMSNYKPVQQAVSESGQSSGKFKKHHRFPVNFPANFPANGDGDVVTTVENAKTYYKNLIKHVKKEGTPLRPGAIETYLFAMFDEDKKPGDESERFYGLFTNDGHPKYGKLDFS
ncbi:glucan endo-1,3-beta-glucosidase-like [Spinacia oleracea]|uniref:Glucan endo-1,3-beta-glucosidase-like n=1 Tax=Spinacia oleracea TaxID=3562 RepID=A0ABM3RU90_SPIOL|nr:glucan endo-1,3-beta-glucosidase-like [Spinacia oleracea]